MTGRSTRTDLYTTGRAHVMTFRERIELNRQNGVKHTPELKGATHQDRVDRTFGSQEAYAQAFLDELQGARVDPRDVFAQSFNLPDILYWIQHDPAIGRQAVFLDSVDPTATPPIPRLTFAQLQDLKRRGVRIFAPPISALLALDDAGEIVPSEYARDIRRAGLEIITWTLERTDLRHGATGDFYYFFDPHGKAVKKDSDMYKALDVLARQVNVLGIFSDWSATVTYYANCRGLK
jgi:glycerophosphoryl diester phosphodiesterase